MKKFALALALAAIAAPVLAAGNGAPSGAHYNLNIIGVSKGKKTTMTNNGGRIFVGLGSNDVTVTSRIYLVNGPDFEVCDANAFDAAYDCSGEQVQSQGAVFSLPCNLNIAADGDQDLIPCDDNLDTAYYEVWARALGTPGGSATITTCATDPDTQEEICSSENVLLVRNTGPSKFSNVTKQLTSLVANIDDDPQDERIALFSGGLEDWFWNYDNRGLKLAQLRFYLLD